MSEYGKKLAHAGSQVIEPVYPKKKGPKPHIKKGGDLRSK